MGKNSKERRVYTKECKAKAIALTEKHEKPVAQDLGIRDSVQHKWMKQSREAGREGLPDTGGQGMSRTLVRTDPAAEREQDAEGGQRNPKKATEL
ncbi:MAG: transposase [Treponema sp.]|jgi:transposase-like protein|nr:transposase [Treponema sp.]